MKYSVRFTETARAQLRAIDQPQALRILRKVTELLEDPYGNHTTALVGSDDSERRLRVGDYRVVYTVLHDVLCVRVVRIGHRSGVYKK